MRIRKLYIRDFGIFFNQTLEDLGSGMVVMGGLNRAGKTTFLHILRHLGYGFPQGKIYPAARDKYDVEGILSLEGGVECNLRVTGFSEPLFSFNQGNNRTVLSNLEVYNQLDLFTYQQIFTISLDELQKIPGNISGKEMEKLQSILLGAGLKDIIQIPQLENAFLKEAEKIGGKTGSPKVKEFKPYNSEVRKGLKLRDQALQQVDKYYEKQNHLRVIDEEIEKGERELTNWHFQVTRLDVLKNSYTDCKEICNLEILINDIDLSREDIECWNTFSTGFFDRIKDLRQRFFEASDKFQESLELFKTAVGKENETEISGLKDRLLANGDQIKGVFQKLSGLKEKLHNYRENKADYTDQKSEIMEELHHLNSGWQGDFQKILKINTDEIRQDEMVQQIEKYKDLTRKAEGLEDRLKDLKKKELGLKKAVDGKELNSTEAIFKKFFGLSCLFIFGGIGLSIINIWLGLVVGFVGIIGTGLVLTFRFFSESNVRAGKRSLLQQLTSIGLEIKEWESEITQVNNSISLIEQDLDIYRQKLDLDKTTSPELLKSYYRQVLELKRDIFRLEKLEERLKLNQEELMEEKKRIVFLMAKVYQLVPEELDNILEDGELFSLVEKSVRDLELAKNLEESEALLNALVKEIKEVVDVKEGEDLSSCLNRFISIGEKFNEYSEFRTRLKILKGQILQALKTDRVRRAMELSGVDVMEDEDLLKAFLDYYAEFTSLQDVNRAYEEAEGRLRSLEIKISSLKEERQSLRDEINRLGTTENLEKAQSQIDQGRSLLRPLAERYAIYNTAAFLLSQIRKSFIEKTRDSLLGQASGILKEITGGAYREILPPDDLIEADFQTVTGEGIVQETSEILSRGTKEQLFLAVRVSRIKEIKPALPVILDDSLVNFDSLHMGRALDLLIDLAKTHQIFVLTCHPHLVQYVMNRSEGTQYWWLDSGKFTLMEGEELVKRLGGY